MQYALYAVSITATQVKHVVFELTLVEGQQFQILEDGTYTVYQYNTDSSRLHPLMPVKGGATVPYEGVELVVFEVIERELQTSPGITLH